MAKREREAPGAFRTSIGGQALMEGILMRGPKKQSIVVRKTDGELEVKVDELKLIKDRHPVLGWPLIRGVVNFLDSMVKGVQAITYSAQFLPEEEQEEPSKLDLWLDEKLGNEKAEKAVVGIAVLLGICLAVGLFFFLPTLVAGGILHFFPDAPYLVRHLLEGIFRIIIFLAYLALCAQMKDIKRMFAYHGAEHKTIFCYEKGLPLTVDNVRIQSRFHPRCGTSFLFAVIIISILVFAVVFSFITPPNMLVRLLLQLVCLPIVVAVSYELNRLIGRHDNVLTAALSWPGRQLQRLTTNEPDDSMMEVAIAAIELVIPEEKGADAW